VSESVIEICDKAELMSELFNHCLFPDNIQSPTEDITGETEKSKI
jgi:hypothetical protein